MNVLVVDEHPVLREGLRSVLGKEPDLAVVGEASSGEEACAEVERTSPDVAVVGVRIRGSNGMGIARALVARYPELRVVILTSFANNAVLRGVFSIGAHGVVVKESDQSVLRHAVKAVGAGVQFIDPCLEMAASFAGAQARSTEADAYGLKETERQVLRDAVRAVGAGSSYMDESVEVFAASLGLGGARHRHGLSSGEFEAIRLLPEGLSNRAI
ncbi:MAG: response regulator, partial [Acidimicrobiales bacterium]